MEEYYLQDGMCLVTEVSVCAVVSVCIHIQCRHRDMGCLCMHVICSTVTCPCLGLNVALYVLTLG